MHPPWLRLEAGFSGQRNKEKILCISEKGSSKTNVTQLMQRSPSVGRSCFLPYFHVPVPSLLALARSVVAPTLFLFMGALLL